MSDYSTLLLFRLFRLIKYINCILALTLKSGPTFGDEEGWSHPNGYGTDNK